MRFTMRLTARLAARFARRLLTDLPANRLYYAPLRTVRLTKGIQGSGTPLQPAHPDRAAVRRPSVGLDVALQVHQVVLHGLVPAVGRDDLREAAEARRRQGGHGAAAAAQLERPPPERAPLLVSLAPNDVSGITRRALRLATLT